MNPNEQKIFEALGDSRWDWRTLEGLKRSTGLPGALILETILDNRSKIEIDVPPAHDNLLFRLAVKDGRESDSIIDQALKVLSLGTA